MSASTFAAATWRMLVGAGGGAGTGGESNTSVNVTPEMEVGLVTTIAVPAAAAAAASPSSAAATASAAALQPCPFVKFGCPAMIAPDGILEHTANETAMHLDLVLSKFKVMCAQREDALLAMTHAQTRCRKAEDAANALRTQNAQLLAERTQLQALVEAAVHEREREREQSAALARRVDAVTGQAADLARVVAEQRAEMDRMREELLTLRAATVAAASSSSSTTIVPEKHDKACSASPSSLLLNGVGVGPGDVAVLLNPLAFAAFGLAASAAHGGGGSGGVSAMGSDELVVLEDGEVVEGQDEDEEEDAVEEDLHRSADLKLVGSVPPALRAVKPLTRVPPVNVRQATSRTKTARDGAAAAPSPAQQLPQPQQQPSAASAAAVHVPITPSTAFQFIATALSQRLASNAMTNTMTPSATTSTQPLQAPFGRRVGAHLDTNIQQQSSSSGAGQADWPQAFKGMSERELQSMVQQFLNEHEHEQDQDTDDVAGARADDDDEIDTVTGTSIGAQFGLQPLCPVLLTRKAKEVLFGIKTKPRREPPRYLQDEVILE